MPRQKYLDKKLSDENRSITLTGKTQPKSENKSMPLPSQTQKKYENTPLPAQTKTWRGSCKTNIGLSLFQVRLNQS